jgi:type IX secretion system PorP/SprF family membrane protein
MKKYLLPCLLICYLGIVKAQQLPQPTQYLINPILINPAYAGTTNDTEVKFSYRSQLNGYEGAPQSFFVSADVPLFIESSQSSKRDDIKQALGGYILYDKFGVLGTFHVQGLYSVHIPVSENMFVAVGASFGYANYVLDKKNLIATSYDDPLIYADARGGNLYGTIGLTFYSEDFFVGVSSNVLKEKNANFFNPNIVETVHQVIVGGRIPLENANVSRFALIPSILLRKNAVGLQADINFTVKMSDIIWGGVTYRGKEGLAFLAGMGFERLNFTYSYDYFRNSVITGAHEITIGVKIHKHKLGYKKDNGAAKLFF